ncbi:phosphodiester glycosidase family protein [Nocardioides sp. Bht2]|uniref:phosphodiester glycosidase family protein n=1 Tax=Nocardioides sp. Bht2 TaxID=3392297 RepID=UPI0039B61D4D
MVALRSARFFSVAALAGCLGVGLMPVETPVAEARFAAPSVRGDGSQTSDGEPGWVPRVPWSARLAKRDPVDTSSVSWPAGPGVTYRRWVRTDERGPARIHVVRIDLRTKGLKVAAIGAPSVAGRQEMSTMVKQNKAIAGINGDFFDIGNTGAPLGVATAGARLRHGPVAGWNNAIYKVNGRWAVGELPVVAKVLKHPELVVTNVNSPQVAKGGLGVYTSAWGVTPGRAVTGGQRIVRQVVLRNGRVVSNTRKLSVGKPIRGTVLIGRGRSATKLAPLKVGKKVRVSKRLKGRPTVAISGDKPLLIDGVRRVIDNVTLHPRTAVGIDRDTKSMYWVVVDGRTASSRGFSMVELANLMIELGVEDALNLDGGGSSTMVARSKSGKLSVRNRPSDGRQRVVPNGLGVFVR